jgi:16S rRNA (guanine527-N7)-methyltransferase
MDTRLKTAKDLLTQGLAQLHLQLTADTCDKLLNYVGLLQKWNQSYNLTAITATHEILIKHIFDSLTITSYIIGPRIIDVGSGAGLPGIPLALALPQYQFVLLDSSNKKTLFLEHVKLSLGISNVNIVTARMKEFRSTDCFATIVTRATSSLKAIIEETQHLSCTDGQLLAMKGKYPEEELSAIVNPVVIHRLQVPLLEAKRHLIRILLKPQ